MLRPELSSPGALPLHSLTIHQGYRVGKWSRDVHVPGYHVDEGLCSALILSFDKDEMPDLYDARLHTHRTILRNRKQLLSFLPVIDQQTF